MSKLPSVLKLDPARVESRKRLAQMHVADRFKAMFGLFFTPPNDTMKTSFVPFSENNPTHQDPYGGYGVSQHQGSDDCWGSFYEAQDHERTEADEAAEKARQMCNNLTQEERDALFEEGMRIVNGTTPSNLPASQPKSCQQDPDK